MGRHLCVNAAGLCGEFALRGLTFGVHDAIATLENREVI